MRSETSIVVLKFGSSVLRSEKELPAAVHEIYRWWKAGHQVVAVVSAFGNTTDDLMQRAHAVCNQPAAELIAALLSTGEAASSALLGLALNRAGIRATVLDAERAGLFTVGPKLDANLVSIAAPGIHAALRDGVVVLPGFVGRDENGGTTLLGRGGSDLTALFLAHHLDGVCHLIKDVDGLYTSDPNSVNSIPAYRFARISYRTAGKVGGEVVQPKAIEFAEAHRQRFFLSSIGANCGTEVGPYSDRIAATESNVRPLRVALLGCGTVGGGVYERLAAMPELFEVIGVATRNIERAIREEVPVRLITTHLDKLIEGPIDVVIELLGGTEPARTLVSKALSSGCHVVTANKALLANDVCELEQLASHKGVTLRYAAAVGGVVPMVETVRKAREYGVLSSLSGVLNGTTNFILDKLAQGLTFPDAVCLAQQLGYAESDPQVDLDGTDAVQKLILLARAAFDMDIPFDAVRREGINETTPVKTDGNTKLRLIADCRRTAYGFEATVAPVELAANHLLAEVEGVGNRLLIEAVNGRSWSVSGQGAGRWPTTEAVIGDLLDIKCASFDRVSFVQAEECVA